jgi:hypothetical protein
MPRKQALYYKNGPLLFTELSCVKKKKIKKILNKGFIRELILLTAIPLLFTMKPGGSI